MTPRKQKRRYKYDLIEVIWDDASTGHGWEEIPKELRPQIAYTVGFLVAESENHILLASSYDDNSTTNTRIQIPKGMIKERHLISAKSPAS